MNNLGDNSAVPSGKKNTLKYAYKHAYKKIPNEVRIHMQNIRELLK